MLVDAAFPLEGLSFFPELIALSVHMVGYNWPRFNRRGLPLQSMLALPATSINRILISITAQLLLCATFLLPAAISNAQCAGKTVLFYENFGGGITSPLPGPPLPPGKTTYRFDSLGTLFDGEYGIRRTTADLTTGSGQFGSWLVGNDHSGGYMMLVNADFTPGKFYETRIDNLCRGSQLFFSAWIANLIRLGSVDPLDPVLRFELTSAATGTLLAEYITPRIPRYTSLTWTQYGFNFSLPPTENAVILRIFNNQAGGNGNDLCLDDIEISLCGPVMTPSLTGGFQNTPELCTGNNLNLSVNVEAGFYNNPVYQWQFNNGMGWNPVTGATNRGFNINNIQKSDSGRYRLLVAEAGNINSANCRSASPEIPVKVFAPVVPVLSGKTSYCEQDTLDLSSSTPALEYRWTKGTSGILSTTNRLQLPNSTVADAGSYTLQLVTNGGCSSSNSIAVTVQTNPLVRRLPNDTLLCGNAVLAVDVQQPGATTYLWSDGVPGAQRDLSAAGLYTVRTSSAVCSRTDSIRITRNNLPSVALGNDTLLCSNETLLLNAVHPLADSWRWNDNSTNSTLLVTTAGTYTVQVTNNCGTVSDAIRIDYQDCGDIVFVPTAFTPNQDGLNDILRARAYFRIESFDFRLYNRWGQQVFTASSLSEGWDGTIKNQPAAAGQYSWLIVYQRNGVRYTQKGWVQLLR